MKRFAESDRHDGPLRTSADVIFPFILLPLYAYKYYLNVLMLRTMIGGIQQNIRQRAYSLESNLDIQLI